MQGITPPTVAQLLAPGQEPKAKLEIYNNASWINLNNLHSGDGLVGWWAFDEGAGMVAYDHSKYGNDGTLYPTPVPISACDATTGWTGTDLSIDTDDKKEGTGSLKDDVAEPVVASYYKTIYNPAGSWDWSAKEHILFWLKSDRPNTAFTTAIVIIYDTSENYRYWNLTFSAGEWTAVKKLLSAGDAQSATPPDLALINRVEVQFRAADTTPFYKKIDDLRIDDRPQWVDGKVGKCLDFDGVDDYVDLESDVVMGASGSSISLWFKLDAFGGMFVGKAADNDTYICVLNSTTIVVQTDVVGTVKSFTVPTISLGTWYHLVVTRSNNITRVYLDTVESSSGGQTQTDILTITQFGRQGSLAVNWYNGLIDEVRIYNRVLTAGEIKALFELKGKNYLESASVSLGGASPTPNPIGGKWSASLSNDLSIFHPQHPTSAYIDWLKTGRQARISIGATYGGVDYIWQRLIGYMGEPKFSTPGYKVSISGQDYMKRLEDIEFQELDATYPNHWGLSTPFDSWPSDGLLGAEMYTNHDAMDTTDDGGAGFHNVTNWVVVGCNFDPLDEAGKHVGKMTGANAGPPSNLKLPDVGTNAVAGRKYRVRFKHKIVGGDGSIGLRIQIQQTALIKQMLYFPTDDWSTETFYFTATDTAAIKWWFILAPIAYELWLDDFSVWEYKPEDERYYDLTGADANQKGPYHVTYDDGGGADPVQQGEEDEGWWYEEATGHVFFDRNKTVIDGAGLNNVVIYYHTAADPEDAVARILYFAGLYADEATALAAMDNDDPGFAIDKVWFEAGTTFLSAIKMLCEVCDYRFHFTYAGQPVFKAPPGGGVVFTFSSPLQIESQRTYQSEKEIKNRVIIKGIKQAEPVNREDSVPSELTGEANDAALIAVYGERTLTITNHLFQTQARINAMCITLRDRYKTPKWYADLRIPFKPIPLELGDEIQWEERLSPTLPVTHTGIIRDIKISNYKTTYKVVKT